MKHSNLYHSQVLTYRATAQNRTNMEDEKDLENLYGMVVLRAFKDNTYSIETSMSLDESFQLLIDCVQDLEDGTLEGLDEFEEGVSRNIH